ncbi:hypothetical protein V5J35_003397 [Endozoicomonas sp. NE40]|uniref:Uncharacterized protein n=1 Tax=Endozoicomonas lisbonensis TaxID=3120522 RepID=A0ABV2SKC2_9GAMM
MALRPFQTEKKDQKTVIKAIQTKAHQAPLMHCHNINLSLIDNRPGFKKHQRSAQKLKTYSAFFSFPALHQSR